MPVGKDILSLVPDEAASTSSNNGGASSDILSLVPDEASSAPPQQNRSKSSKAAVTGLPHKDVASDLKHYTDVANKFFGEGFIKTDPNAKVVFEGTTNEGNPARITLGVDGSQKEERAKMGDKVDNSPVNYASMNYVDQGHLNEARGHIGQEVKSSSDYIISDIEKLKAALGENKGFLEGLKAKGIDLDDLAVKAADPNGNPDALKKYMTFKTSMMQSDKEREIEEAKQLYKPFRPTGYSAKGEYEEYEKRKEQFDKKVSEIDEKYKDEMENVSSAAFGLASRKVINEFKNEYNGDVPTSPFTVGEKVLSMLGNEEDIKNYKHMRDNYQSYDPAEKVAIEAAGYRAMEYARMSAIAEGDDRVARKLGMVTQDWQNKILDFNPDYKKQQLVKAISDRGYEKVKNKAWIGLGYEYDEAGLKQLMDEMNIPEKDRAGIKPEDLQTTPNVLSAFADGYLVKPAAQFSEFLVRHVGNPIEQLMGGEVDQRWTDNFYKNEDWYSNTSIGKNLFGLGTAPAAADMFGQQKKVSVDQGTYLQEVDNPDYKPGSLNFNPSIGNILTTMAEGAGQVMNLGQASKVIGGKLMAAGMGAKAANAAGMATYMGITNMDNSYKSATEAIGDDPDKELDRMGLAGIYLATEIASEFILPDYKIADKIFGTAAFKDGIIDLIQKKGINSVTKEMLSSTMARALKDAGVDIAKESLEEVSGVYGNMIGEMLLAPEKYKQTSYNTEAMQQGIAAGISSILPVGGGSIAQARQAGPMYKNALFMAGSNPNAVISQIDEDLKNDVISDKEATEKKAIVNMLSNLVSTTPKVSPVNDKPMTAQQRVDYVATRLNIKLQEAEAEKVKDDAVLVEKINARIEEERKNQNRILENAGPAAPVEDTPKNKGDENKQKADAEKGEEGNSPADGQNQRQKEEGLLETTTPAPVSTGGSVLGFEDEVEDVKPISEMTMQELAQAYHPEIAAQMAENANLQGQTDTNGEENQLQGATPGVTENAEIGQEGVRTNDNSIIDASQNEGVPQTENAIADETISTNTSVATNGVANVNEPDVALQQDASAEATAIESAGAPAAVNREDATQPQLSVIQADSGQAAPQATVSANDVGTSSASNIPAATQAGNDADTFIASRTEEEASISNQVGEQIRSRFAQAPKKIGRAFTRTLPTGERMRGRYAIVPANSITPSNNPANFETTEGFPLLEGARNPNDRDYTLKDNQESVTDTANNYNGEAVQNTPTVDKNGIVIDGNERTMAGQIAADNGTDTQYLESLIDNAEIYGFTPEEVQQMIDNGESPRLVFIPDTVRPYTTQTFGLFNKDNVKPKSPLELAIEYSRTLPADIRDRIANILDRHDDMANFYKNIEDQKDVANLLIRAGVIQQKEAKLYYDSSTGALTKNGRDLLDNLMLSQVLDEDALRLIQNPDEGYTGLRNRIIKGVKYVIAMDNRGKYNMGYTLNLAVKFYNEVEKYRDAVNSVPGIKKKLSREDAATEFAAQFALYRNDAEESKAVSHTYQWLVNPAITEFKNQMKRMANSASPANSQHDIFGELPSTKLELILNAKKDSLDYAQAIEEAKRPIPGDNAGNGPETVQQPATEDNSTDTGNRQGRSEEVVAAEGNAEPVALTEQQLLDNEMKDILKNIESINAVIRVKEDKMEDQRKRGQTGSAEYKVNLSTWQNKIKELRDAKKLFDETLRKYDALSTKQSAKKTADTLRASAKNIRKKGTSKKALAADPFGIVASLRITELAGRELVSRAMELAAAAIEAGATIRVGINMAINHIKDRIAEPAEQKYYDELANTLGYNETTADVPNLDATEAGKAARAFRSAIPGAKKLSQKNTKIAENIIQQIKDGNATLPEMISQIESEPINEKTKANIIEYINSAVGRGRTAFVYNEESQKQFQNLVKPLILKGLKYDEIVAEMEKNPLLRGGSLTFAERQIIRDEIARNKDFDKTLNDARKITDKTSVRAVIRAVGESAYVNDDFALREAMNNIDGRYEVQSREDLLAYVDDIIESLGVEAAERLALTGALEPNRRQVLLAKVAVEYKNQKNQKGLEDMLARIARDATAYGQGVESTKLVYQLLGMAGVKGANQYFEALVQNMQQNFLLGKEAEVGEYKARIEELKNQVAELMANDQVTVEKISKILNEAQATRVNTKKQGAQRSKKLGDTVTKTVDKQVGKLTTPAEIAAARQQIVNDLKNAFPLFPAENLQMIIDDVLAKFDAHVAEINEGKIYEFYRDVMFPQQQFNDRDTQIAERLMEVVNAANLATGAVDQFTLDAIAQEFGVQLPTDGFVDALNELVDRANSDEDSLLKNKPTRVKDDIAQLVSLYSVDKTVDYSRIALGQDIAQIATELASIRDGNLDSVENLINNRFAGLNLSPAQAKEVTDAVLGRYRELLKENAGKYLSKHLGNENKKAEANHDNFYDKVLREINALELSDTSFQQLFAEKYGLKPVTESDFAKMREIAEKLNIATPNTNEYGLLVEQFFTVLHQKDPMYITKIYQGLRASKILFSIGFTLKTIISNWAKIQTRGLSEYARSVYQGRPNRHLLAMTYPIISKMTGGPAFDSYARTSTRYVWDGGIPPSNIQEQEFATTDKDVRTRLEEYANPEDSAYLRFAKKIMRWGSRLQNSVDTYGQIRVAEMVQFSRLQEQMVNAAKTNDPDASVAAINAKALEAFKLAEYDLAAQHALQEFNKLGIVVDENSARFKVRVMEIQRENRDKFIQAESKEQARKDFWKTTEKGVMGGIGGVYEKMLSELRDLGRKPLETHPKAALAYDGAVFQLFGFVGGMSRFYEDSLEHILPYSLIKAGLIQLAKKQNMSPEELQEMDRKQFDIIFKGSLNLALTTLSVGAYALFRAMVGAPPDEEDQKGEWGFYGSGEYFDLSTKQITKGLARDGFMIDGHKIPFDFVVPNQMAFPIKMYANMEDFTRTDDEKSALQRILFGAWEAMPATPYSAGDKSSFFGNVVDFFGARDENKKEQAFQKIQDFGYKKIGDFVAAYVPIPQRLVTESYQLFDQRLMQKVEPTLAITEGDQGWGRISKEFINFGGRALFSTSQALGINNILSTAGVLNKPAVDYRGREVNMGMQYSSSFTALPNMFKGQGEPLPYDVIDDILAKNQLAVKYYSRYGSAQMMFHSRTDEAYYRETDEGKKEALYDEEIQIMTDQQFYDFNYSMGKIVAQQLEGKEEAWPGQDVENIKSEWNEIQEKAYTFAKKGVESGMNYTQIIEAFTNGEEPVIPEPKEKEEPK